MNNYILKNLSLFVGVVLFSVLMVGTMQYFSIDRELIAKQQKELDQINSNFRKEIKQTIINKFALINFLAKTSYPEVAVTFGMGQQFNEIANQFSEDSKGLGMILTDVKGHIISFKDIPASAINPIVENTFKNEPDRLIYSQKGFVIYKKKFHSSASDDPAGYLIGVQNEPSISEFLQSDYMRATLHYAQFKPKFKISFAPLEGNLPKVEFHYINPTSSFFSFIGKGDVKVFILSGFILIVFTYLLWRSLKKPVGELLQIVAQVSEAEEEIYSGPFPKDRLFRKVADALIQMHKHRFLLEKAKREKEVFEHLAHTASQVAHDIRSPLAALDVACSVTHELPEEKRLLIRQAVSRIRDIANNLVHKSRLAGVKDSAASHDKKETEEFAICLLPSLVDELITEKRLQHRANMNIEILADLDKKSYGLFAKIQPIEFKRVLSNLVNNAVEAQRDKGQVVVSLNVGVNPVVGARRAVPLRDDMVEIQIRDNGKGISPDILPKLMQRGATFEKKGGSGLGLYHAKTTLQSWGGDLKIESIYYVGADRCVGPNTGQTHRSAPTGSGTVVTILLKKEPAPAWFVPRLTLLPHVHLAILDDDVSIHQIWDGRLEEMGFEKERIHHFSTPSALRKWFQQLKDKENMIYLFDYELIGQGQTGLDLIQELSIARRSILVTSRYEEPDVLKQCQKQGVKVIPKPMAGFVPIEQRTFLNPDGILIDDDESLRISWKLMAEAMNKILKVYESVEAFFKEAAQFDKATPIYIDSHLGNGIKGEEVSKKLFEMGFTNIYLATGYNPNDFGDLPWIKGIVGKAPPWQ